MYITHNKNDQYVFLSVATGLVYLVWVIYDPTQGQCTTAGIFYPIGRVLIVWAWLIYLCLKRASNKEWNWIKFATGSVIGGWLFGILWVIGYYFSDFTKSWSTQQILQPIVWVAPAAVISGLYSAFSPTLKKAAILGLFIFLLQILIDFLIWLPWSCVY